VLLSIQGLGYQWVWVGDEFGTERKLYWIDDLKNQECGPTSGRKNVFTPDKRVLWTTHWDSHFSFLVPPRVVLAASKNRIALRDFSAIQVPRSTGASGHKNPAGTPIRLLSAFSPLDVSDFVPRATSHTEVAD
jgi:hypothetical protein